MKSAQLMNRGEQFYFMDGGTRYEGECVWSREKVPGSMPRPIYPLWLIAESIRDLGPKRLLPLSWATRLQVAREVKALLEAREKGCIVKIVELETTPPAATSP